MARRSPAIVLPEQLEDDFQATVICRLTVPGDPTTKGRPRLVKGHVVTPTRTKRWEEYIRWHLRAGYPNLEPNATHSLGIRLAFYTSTRQRRDIDNLAKLVLDALNGGVWRDDFQVEEMHARVQRGTVDARTEIEVYTLAERPFFICEQCGTRVVNWSLALGNSRYCSKACYDEAQRRGSYQACYTCGSRIYRQRDRLGQARFFCSSECKRVANAGKFICKQCKREIEAYRSSARRKVFCSAECQAAFHQARSVQVGVLTGACRDCGGPTSRRSVERCLRCHAIHRARAVAEGR